MINEIKGEIPCITGFATTAVLNAVENKILKVSHLVKKQIMMRKYHALNLIFHHI